MDILIPDVVGVILNILNPKDWYNFSIASKLTNRLSKKFM